ncbi:hypothetical protein TNCV_3877971 [Trichonephila clavipes]|uniref:Uncharacterized protein n=1 Tax=Trichonephila clavipes TaxID=2585209 RepID=A0A8X6SSB8_TRICX|nr:hypothetical protein TNCV_3877971 [Trichonephila clavipes]
METIQYGNIDPLTSNNYHRWKQDIETNLMDRDCRDIISKRVKRDSTTFGKESEESYFDRAEETYDGSEDVNIDYSALNWIKKAIPRKDGNRIDIFY